MHDISKYHFIVKTQLPSTAKYCELKQLNLAPKNLSQTGECLKKNHLSEYWNNENFCKYFPTYNFVKL